MFFNSHRFWDQRLEIVSDLSTNAFVAALKRFISRKGMCKQIFCGNGKNFVGAPRKMTEVHSSLTYSEQRYSLHCCTLINQNSLYLDFFKTNYTLVLIGLLQQFDLIHYIYIHVLLYLIHNARPRISNTSNTQ